MFLVFVLFITAASAITDIKTNCSFSFSSLLVDGAVKFDTVQRATFANCFFNWEDWFNCSDSVECDLVQSILSAFVPNDTVDMFQHCNGIKVSDFDNCVDGFIMRYGALYVPDGTHVSYVPQKKECFGQLKVLNSVIWFITDHVSNETCCSSRSMINPFVPMIENN
nr:MAG: NS7a [Canine coronavirus]